MCAATVLGEVLTTCVPTSWFHVNFLWFLRCCCLRWYQSMLIFNLAAVGKRSFRAPRSQVRPLLCDFCVCVCVCWLPCTALRRFHTISGNDRRLLLCCEADKLSLSWLDVMSGHKQLWEVFFGVGSPIQQRGMSHQSCYVRLLCDVLVCFALIMSTSDLSAYISKVDLILIIGFAFPNSQ